MELPMKAATVLVLLMLTVPAMALATHTNSVTLPDTSCASAVGVGASDIPHAYYASSFTRTSVQSRNFDFGGSRFSHDAPTKIGLNPSAAFGSDACPDHYSGELGFGIGGVWLFAREDWSTEDQNDGHPGDGVWYCYGSMDPTAGDTTGHHGAHATINVRDDVLGGSVGFTVTRDYNRTHWNPFLWSSNDFGHGDCGDGIIEPCEGLFNPNTFPGCNPLDESTFVFPQDGICTGLSSLGDPVDLLDTGLISLLTLVVNFATSLLGLATGGASCDHAVGPNTWTAPGTLGEYAGADGAIVIFIQSSARFDAGHFGTGTTGAVWTS